MTITGLTARGIRGAILNNRLPRPYLSSLGHFSWEEAKILQAHASGASRPRDEDEVALTAADASVTEAMREEDDQFDEDAREDAIQDDLQTEGRDFVEAQDIDELAEAITRWWGPEALLELSRLYAEQTVGNAVNDGKLTSATTNA
jgi:hypothetical protein